LSKARALIAACRAGALSPQYLLGVYIPSVALIGGAFIFNKGLLPYAAVIVVLLGGFAFLTDGEFSRIVN